MSNAFIGEIRKMTFRQGPPVGWLACDGTTLNISDNQALYSLIGVQFGGDGVTNFKLPNLNGSVPVGQGTSTTTTPTTRVFAQQLGEDQVTITSAQGFAHNHPFQATSNQDSTDSPANALFGADSTATIKHYEPIPASPTPTYKPLAPDAVSTEGGNQPHSNIMPSLCIMYCICTNGIYPQRP